jgi:hypothetical protein
MLQHRQQILMFKTLADILAMHSLLNITAAHPARQSRKVQENFCLVCECVLGVSVSSS